MFTLRRSYSPVEGLSTKRKSPTSKSFMKVVSEPWTALPEVMILPEPC